MTNMWGRVERELEFEQPPELTWRALTASDLLASWMYPNTFAGEAGHEFTLSPPANPEADFDGTVHGQVLAATEPEVLVYSWSGGPVVATVVRYRLQTSESGGTVLSFEHSGFDLASPFGADARTGAELGWRIMHRKLEQVLGRPTVP